MTRKYTKRAPRWTRKDYNKLEMVARIRSPHGAVLAEYTFVPGSEGYGVRIVNYFPSGDIESHGRLNLDQFLREINRIKEGRLDGDQDWETILASRPQD